MRRLAIPPAALLNTACYDHCPELLAAYHEATAEFVGHGVTNAVHPNELGDPAEQAAVIAEVRDAILAAVH